VVWGGGVPFLTGEKRGVGKRLCPLPGIFFLLLALKMVSFGAFWVVFL